MPRKIAWALLIISVALSSLWHLQTQWNYRAFVRTAQGITLQLTQASLDETPQSVRLRFTLVLKNSTERTIPIEGASCLLYAGQEFLGPCAISGEAPATAPPHGEWKLDIITEITGHYLENYRKAQAEEIRVQGGMQIELPIGSDSITVTRRFRELIPKR